MCCSWLNQSLRFGSLGGFTRRPVVLCKTVTVLLAVTVACTLMITFMDWSISTVSKLLPESNQLPTTELMMTDFSDASLSYGIVVDCGSSGSRVFVYCWPPHSGESSRLLNIRIMLDSNSHPVIMKMEPGLSSFVSTPSESSEHIAPLLKYAAVHIPKDKHRETPVYIMATAGLRLLDERDQEAILNDLRVDLALQFEFLFSPTHVEVISGKQEGIYSWIAINHALGKFDHTLHVGDRHVTVDLPNGEQHRRKRTVGIMDLGGASLQVAYELPSVPPVDIDKSLLAEFDLGCSTSDVDHHYRLYVTTYLGLGSNEGRSRYESQLLTTDFNSRNQIANITVAEGGLSSIADPCLSVGRSEHIVRSNVTAAVYGTGDLVECRRRLVSLLNLTSCLSSRHGTWASTTVAPCKINGIRRPPIDFHNSEFFGFSEYFYTMEDILKIGGPYDTIQFQRAAKDYCATNWTTVEKWQTSNAFPRADNNRYRLQCFKSAWLLAVLHEGLGFPVWYRQLSSIQYIDKKEVHWSLGALLFKTKFFPLREIERRRNLDQRVHPPWTSDLRQSFSTVVFFAAIVLVAFILYLWTLQRKSAAATSSSSLRRVQTMSYYMTDAGTEEVVRVDRSHYYTPLAVS